MADAEPHEVPTLEIPTTVEGCDFALDLYRVSLEKPQTPRMTKLTWRAINRTLDLRNELAGPSNGNGDSP